MSDHGRAFPIEKPQKVTVHLAAVKRCDELYHVLEYCWSHEPVHGAQLPRTAQGGTDLWLPESSF